MEQWAAPSPFVEQHTHVFYQENVDGNCIFKWSVRGNAYCWVISDNFTKQLQLNTFERDQWLVLFVEHSVQNAPKAYLEPSQTSKM